MSRWPTLRGVAVFVVTLLLAPVASAESYFPGTLSVNTTGFVDSVYLGAPGGTGGVGSHFGSLGNEQVIYDLTAWGGLVDGVGADFNVYEAAAGAPEFHVLDVFVSFDGVGYVSVKASEAAVVDIPGDEGHNDNSNARSYDLAGSGLGHANFIKLVGTATDLSGPTPGFDLDGVGIIHGGSAVPEPSSVALASVCGLALVVRRRAGRG